MKILIASTNPGKIATYAEVLNELNLEWCSLKDYPNIVAPEENGKTAIDNAVIKAQYYFEKTNLPVIANDSALIIDKLSEADQPGVFVRRQNGRELTDEEMVDFFAKKIEEVGGESDAHYDVGLAIIDFDGKLQVRSFAPARYFISKKCNFIKKGYPLDSLCYFKEMKKYRCELTPAECNKSEGAAFLAQAEFIKEVFLK